jgi:hypothetical protein
VAIVPFTHIGEVILISRMKENDMPATDSFPNEGQLPDPEGKPRQPEQQEGSPGPGNRNPNVHLATYHKVRLSESGVIDAVVDARRYETADTKAAVKNFGFSANQCVAPALVIPLYDHRGEQVGVQIRPDKPRLDREAKPIKYESPPDSRPVIDIPPAAREAVLDCSRPLVITEDVIKADSAVSKGIPCVSIAGIFAWKHDDPFWANVPLSERVVYVAFDSDQATNPNVQKAAARLYNKFRRHGAVPKVLCLPAGENGAKQGLDDFLVGGHTEEDLFALPSLDMDVLLRVEQKEGRPNSGDEQQNAGDARVEEDGQPERKNRLPCIIYNRRPMREIVDDCLRALKKANNPPRIFQQGTVLTRVRHFDDDVFMEPMNIDSFRGFLDRSATFLCKYFEDGEMKFKVKWPPIDLVKDILSLPGWPEDVFPTLSRIARCPFFTASGNLVMDPGYHVESKIWYAPDPGLLIEPVSASPSDTEIEEAKRWLLTELLGDFPLQADADKANAVAFLLTPFVREMILGPIPMGLIEAPAAGTGKGLFANALSIPATGNFLETIPQRQSDEEWRKAITAKLLEMPTHIGFDNITGTLRSAALEAALTSELWADRILGESRMVRMRIRTIWLMTGNNLQIAGDLHRRLVWIRLDARMEHPEERDPSKFRHHPLLPWVKANRAKLIWASLTIIRAWIARGSQLGTKTMGSYESWAATLGGILDMIGVSGFLSNLQTNRSNAGDESAQLESFVEAWKDKFQYEELTIDPLYEMVEANDNLLPFVMDLEKPRGRKIRLGKYISRHRDRTVGNVQIVVLPKDSRSGCLRYCLREVKDHAAGQANQANSGPKGSSSNHSETKKGEGDDADEPHHADRVIFLPLDMEGVLEVCHSWWYSCGSETIEEDELFEPLEAAGAIVARSPEEQRWRCRELLTQLAGPRLGIYRIKSVGYYLDDRGDRHNYYQLCVVDGGKAPMTLAEEEENKRKASTPHVFTAEDFDQIVAMQSPCNVPKGRQG